MYEKVLIENFNDHKWSKFDKQNIIDSIENLNKRLKENNGIFGEFEFLDRYENYKLDDMCIISLYNVSHFIKNLIYEDNKLYGDIKFIKNYQGQVAENLFNMKLLKFSMRFIKYNNYIEKIITLDLEPLNKYELRKEKLNRLCL